MFRVGPDNREEIAAFLSLAPLRNLPLLEALETQPESLVARRGEDGAVEAVALRDEHSGQLRFDAADEDAAERLGEELGAEFDTLLAEGWLAEAFWDAASPAPPARQSQRSLQRITAEEMGPFVCPQLRVASEPDLEEVELRLAEVTAAGETPPWDQGTLGDEARAGKLWVLEEEGELAVLLSIAARCAQGALLGNLLTLPAWRRRGLASLVTGQICRTLLAGLPAVVAEVDPVDPAATGLARKMGFRRVETLLLLER